MGQILKTFTEDCRQFYQRRSDIRPYRARQAAYGSLIGRHGADAVMRHATWIKAVLDNAEARVKEGDNPYFWRVRTRLPLRYGHPCRVLVRGSLNSCLVEFTDGYKVVTSRNYLRKRKDGE